MTLDFEKPDDDGGSPILHYEVERMDVRDGIWVPVGRSTDPHFVADGLKKGSAYQFRVKAVNAEGASEPLQTEEATIAKNPYDKPDRPGTPEPTGKD